MRLVLFGTSEFAVPTLEACAADPRFEVVLVVTQPDARAGRGRKVSTSIICEAAESRGIPFLQPEDVNAAESVAALAAAKADVFLTAAYGQKLSDAVLALPAKYALNLHGSLLPRWRGAAPVQRAIEAGDQVSGVTLITMTARMDAGPMHGRLEVPIAPDDTGGSLMDKLALAARDLLLSVADAMAEGALPSEEQDEAAATAAKMLRKEHGRVRWQQSAAGIDRQVRAMTPWPSAYTFCPTDRSPARIIVVSGDILDVPSPAMPGTVVAFTSGIEVATTKGVYRIVEVKRSGKRALPAAEFLRGFPMPVGTRLQ